MSEAQIDGVNSTPPDPNNTSLSIDIRMDNPISIVNGSPVGVSFGGTNTSTGFMQFPNLAAGVNAAMASAQNYAVQGFTI